MEGCWKCDRNRMDLRQGKCSREEVAWDRLCWRSISDLISNRNGTEKGWNRTEKGWNGTEKGWNGTEKG